MGSPVTSPTAQTCGSAVRPRSSTSMNPRAPSRARVASSPSPAVSGPPADRHQHAIELLGRPSPEPRLDAAARLAQPGHARAEHGPRRTCFSQRRASGCTRSRSTPGSRPSRHLDQRDRAAEGGVDLAQLEADVAAADHEQALGDLGHLERGRGVHQPLARRLDARAGGAGAEPVATIACLKRIFCGSSPSTRTLRESSKTRAPADDLHALALRDRRQPARELADHALGSSTCAADRARCAARRTPRRTPWRARPRRARRPRAGAPWTGCSPRTGRRRPGACRRRRRRSPAPARRSGTPPSSRRGRRRRRRRPPRARGRPSPCIEIATSPAAARPDARGGARCRRRSARRRRRRPRGGRTSATAAAAGAARSAPSRTTGSSRAARHAEDGDLRIVDDRDGAGAAERADVGDREGAAAQIVQGRLALAHALGERAQLARELEQRACGPRRG